MRSKSVVKIFEERDFGEKFNALFLFLSREYKPFFGSMLRILGVPLLLLVLISGLNSAFQLDSIAMGETETGPAVFFIYPIALLVYSLAMTAVPAYLKVYSQKSSPDETVDHSEVRRLTMNKFLPVMGIIILYAIAAAIGLVFLVIPGIYLMIALSLAPVIYVFEDQDIITAMTRSVKLINQNFFGSFAYMFVVGMLALITQSLIQLPIYILAAFIGFGVASDNTPDIPVAVSTLVIAIPSFFAYAVYAVSYAGNVYLYGSLREQSEAPGIMDAIDSFGQRDENTEEVRSF